MTTVSHKDLEGLDTHVIGHVQATEPGGITAVGTAWYHTGLDRLHILGDGTPVSWTAPALAGDWLALLDYRDYNAITAAMTAHNASTTDHPAAIPDEGAPGASGYINKYDITALMSLAAGGYAGNISRFPKVTAADGTHACTIDGRAMTLRLRMAAADCHGFMSAVDKTFVDLLRSSEATALPTTDARLTALESAAGLTVPDVAASLGGSYKHQLVLTTSASVGSTYATFAAVTLDKAAAYGATGGRYNAGCVMTQGGGLFEQSVGTAGYAAHMYSMVVKNTGLTTTVTVTFRLLLCADQVRIYVQRLPDGTVGEVLARTTALTGSGTPITATATMFANTEYAVHIIVKNTDAVAGDGIVALSDWYGTGINANIAWQRAALS